METIQLGDTDNRFTIVRLVNPSSADVDSISSKYKLHPLAVDDVKRGKERCKLQAYGEHSFMVLQRIEQEKNRFHFKDVYVFFSKTWLVLIHRDSESMESFWKRLQLSNRQRLGAILHGLLTTVTEGYDTFVDSIASKIDKFEEKLIRVRKEDLPHEFISMRKDVIALRRSLSYTRDVVAGLMREGKYDFGAEDEGYIRDSYFDLTHMLEMVEGFREFLADLRDSYMTRVSLTLNEVMKKLTVVGTMALPLLVISGIFGMNFPNLPLASWQYGSYTILLLMILLTSALAIYFRRKRWL